MNNFEKFILKIMPICIVLSALLAFAIHVESEKPEEKSEEIVTPDTDGFEKVSTRDHCTLYKKQYRNTVVFWSICKNTSDGGMTVSSSSVTVMCVSDTGPLK